MPYEDMAANLDDASGAERCLARTGCSNSRRLQYQLRMGDAGARWDCPLRFDRFAAGATGIQRLGRYDALDYIVGKRLLCEYKRSTTVLNALFGRRTFRKPVGTGNDDLPEYYRFAGTY